MIYLIHLLTSFKRLIEKISEYLYFKLLKGRIMFYSSLSLLKYL